MKNIAIGCDHGGYEMKEYLVAKLNEWNNGLVTDFGTYSKESVDYPDVAHKLCLDVEAGVYEFGILICGTGNGINMSANNHKGIRSALCWRSDVAKLARQHNNANVLALPGRILDFPHAWECVKEFLTTEFEGGRHQQRIDKIKL